jgi:two-component system, chemotaxis family, chemotaxis protein CheY
MKTILAVDDSLTIRELINFVLTSASFRVVLAEDGIDGVARLSEISPDLIITDLNMPRMDGFKFIEHARATDAGKAIPILVLTTEADADKKARARSAGATGWITKPFNPTQLLDTIKRVLP